MAVMQHSLFRRRVLQIAPFGFFPPLFVNAASTDPPAVPPGFPAHPPELVREMVAVSHGNMKRVTELVQARPALAKASWDWGFGDHETALGAASHVGNRAIAEYLIDQGAAPTLFSATMLGQLEVVKAMVSAKAGVQKTLGPHSISLLAHAKAGGAAAEPVRRYLESLGDADGPASVPFSEEEMGALAGSYVFGTGTSERIDVTVNKGQLLFARSGGTARRLFALGDGVFCPAGARAVRIRFTGNAARMAVLVYDPDLSVTARRQP